MDYTNCDGRYVPCDDEESFSAVTVCGVVVPLSDLKIIFPKLFWSFSRNELISKHRSNTKSEIDQKGEEEEEEEEDEPGIIGLSLVSHRRIQQPLG